MSRGVSECCEWLWGVVVCVNGAGRGVTQQLQELYMLLVGTGALETTVHYFGCLARLPCSQGMACICSGILSL